MTEPPTQPAPASLGRRAVSGAVVTTAAQLAKILIQLLAVVTLARLLTPHDYGLVAMVMAIIGVADTFRDFGLSSAAIQAPSLTRGQQSNLFWVNTGLGLALAALAMVASPAIAALYATAELLPITIALASAFWINGMATQYRADLYRSMRFQRLAIADTVGPATGLAVAIWVALSGGGYWALVAQQLTTASLSLVIVAVSAGWLPGRWRRTESIRGFMSFGWKLAGSQLVTYLGNNIDNLMLGLRVGAVGLGLYSRAYQLIMAPLAQIRAPLSSVAIPVLARVQTDDTRFHRFVQQGQVLLGYTLVLGLAVVAGGATPFVDILLGSRWGEATDVLRLLAAAAALQTLSFVGYWVYVSKGLVGHLLTYSFISTGIRVAFVVAGSFFGLIGVAWAMALSPLIAWPLSFWWLSRRASIPVRALWLGGLRIVAVAGVVGGAAWLGEYLTIGWPAVGQLAIVLLSALLAFALTLVAPVVRKDVVGIAGTVRHNLKRPESPEDLSEPTLPDVTPENTP